MGGLHLEVKRPYHDIVMAHFFDKNGVIYTKFMEAIRDCPDLPKVKREAFFREYRYQNSGALAEQVALPHGWRESTKKGKKVYIFEAAGTTKSTCTYEKPDPIPAEYRI